ncbi:hypothetical protein MZK49_08050 [Ensifer sesbaniae]|uniref:hypothetical protein n=1 Tax=Ensifer sesbaniae TaxID=1214071 RepID=UPI0020007EC8|nr:hypothetical protein [Ensifer sesbaniae]
MELRLFRRFDFSNHTERRMKPSILRAERTSKLGRLGETLAEERLKVAGFKDVRNLNLRTNYPFADLIAELSGQRYLISVKSRNEFRADGKLNECYNAVKFNEAEKRTLQAQGKSQDEITAIIWEAVDGLAQQWNACPAWIVVPMRPEEGSYSAYFGLASVIRHRRSIPVQPADRARYMELAPLGTFDARITRDLRNGD